MKIEGYTFFGIARKGGEGGGVGICVKNEMKIAVGLKLKPLKNPFQTSYSF